MPRLNVVAFCGILSSLSWSCEGLVHLRSSQAPGELPLNQSTLLRAEANLAVANAASKESENNAKDMVVSQQELVAKMAMENAEDTYQLAASAVPEAKQALNEVGVFVLKAQEHAKHAQKMAEKAKHIAEEAAEKAAKAIREQIRDEAAKAAEQAHATATANWGKDKNRKIAIAVAAAAEPYHLALLRAQKAVEENYEKAKGCIDSSQKLLAKAQSMATLAQKMQEAGLGMQAKQMMATAQGTLSEAANLKAWSVKLYDQANKLNQGLGYYQGAQAMAAANAAAVTLVNPPPEMPPN